ncbi:MAG: M48 family metallopeptidase [Proteobacteria bacterium]|nr:M48 family metallopeptidase [Pseudomonadota bacterium]MCP4921201.1 M48 family metallopeptidase [Pseudomonadota bacterium]
MSLDPTAGIDLDFTSYVEGRQGDFATRVEGGVPSYAFSLDWTIRRQLDKVAPLRWLAEALAASVVPYQRALQESRAVAVGPGQFPQVHAMGVSCAERLGIGIPQIFIVQDPITNGFTYATGEVDQVIVLTSGLVEATTESQLHTVIGHECGHIHNRHVIYNTVWEVLTNGLARTMLHKMLRIIGRSSTVIAIIEMLFNAGTSLLLSRWHRCAEITCDRAGLICAGDIEASRSLHGVLAAGHLGDMEGFSSDAYAEQMKTHSKSAARAMELFNTHPLGPQRVQAVEAFFDCDILPEWRPELRAGTMRPKDDVDSEIEGMFL